MVPLKSVVFALLLSCARAQLWQSEFCTPLVGGTAKCERKGCEAGRVPHAMSGAPWMCGGWNRDCCIDKPKTFDETNCGLGESIGRILEGAATSMCDWPFIASIRGRNSQASAPLNQFTSAHACGGTIISDRWVLTHAACCYMTGKTLNEVSSEFVVVVGEYNISRLEPNPQLPGTLAEQFVPIERCVVHPNFASIATLSDLQLSNSNQLNGHALALLKLAQPIVNNCASAACLPAAKVLGPRKCESFDQCVILGWGFDTANYTDTDDTLKQGFVKIYKGEVCDLLEQKVYAQDKVRSPGSICQTSSTGNGACLADQGGPVLCYDGTRWTVQGIIPFNLCSNNQVNPYVIDVNQATDWIYTTIQQLS